MIKYVKGTLNDIMNFDHVVQVHPDGTVTDGPSGVYAPKLHDDELHGEGWELLTGYTGQYGYSGAIMHPSEYIGGHLARDILATPGLYVALLAYVTPDDESNDQRADDVSGWAVAYRPV